MRQNVGREEQEYQIDLKRLLDAIFNKIWLIAVVGVIGTLLGYWISRSFVKPLYEASTMLYVNNSTINLGDNSISVNSSDLSAAKSLVDSYIVILESRETLQQVKEYTGVDLSVEELQAMIRAYSVNSTEIFQVVVRGESCYQVDRIADALAYILPGRIDGIIEGSSAHVVEMAVVPQSPSYPSHMLNALVGLVLGVVLSFGAVVAVELMNVKIRTEEDLAQLCDVPVLAAVPDMHAPAKAGYYAYSSSTTPAKSTALVGPKISFAAAEAYKLLRTKLEFAFPDTKSCHIIGITSAMAGEGKSLSAVNLAYALSQLDRRVLLVDCDMRRPTVSSKLRIRKFPGLSNYLTGQCPLEELYQNCGLEEAEDAFQVIAAGRNPPNPVELLSSPRMAEFLLELRGCYDTVILDLPPVGEVSDALAIAGMTDGIVLVTRQDYCNSRVFSSTVRQLGYVGGRFLGIVYNCATQSGSGYTRRYYKRYRRGYEGSYASGHPAKKKSEST